MRLVSDSASVARPIPAPGERCPPGPPSSPAFRPRAIPTAERALHAALVLPFIEGLAQAASALLGLGGDRPLAPVAANHLGGAAFAAGMSIPELSHHLEHARRAAPARGSEAAACELDGRAGLLRGLLSHQGGSALRRLCAEAQPGQEARFGHWLTRLQAAWYADQDAAALEAVQAGAALAGSPTPAGDLLLFHVFATLALARWSDSTALPAVKRHRDAARRLDARCRASGGAIDRLAQAACDGRRGHAVAALRGFEQAAAGACDRGLHWLATLAHEQAARHALDAGLVSAACHYRQQSLGACRRWGALGRLDALQQAWRDLPCPAADERPAGIPVLPAVECAEGLGMAIAHELNQPLSAVTLHAAAAAKWLQRAEPDLGRALDSLALIGLAGRQAADIVRGMQRLAAARQTETAGVDLDGAVHETLYLLQRRLRQHRIDVELAPGLAGCAVEANRVQLQQVVTNLVVNAIEAHASATEPGMRRIRIETRRAGADAVELAVSDNGPGIAPSDQARIFTSRFSTKARAASAAAGMGLSISLSIARAHGGHLWFEPAAPHGACFRLRLPLTAALPEASVI